MKIYDCFMYYDEDELLDLRFNILDQYVDKFVITESKFTHSGKIKNKNFHSEKFKKFYKKIEYFYIEDEPKGSKKILNRPARPSSVNKITTPPHPCRLNEKQITTPPRPGISTKTKLLYRPSRRRLNGKLRCRCVW